MWAKADDSDGPERLKRGKGYPGPPDLYHTASHRLLPILYPKPHAYPHMPRQAPLRAQSPGEGTRHRSPSSPSPRASAIGSLAMGGMCAALVVLLMALQQLQIPRPADAATTRSGLDTNPPPLVHINQGKRPEAAEDGASNARLTPFPSCSATRTAGAEPAAEPAAEPGAAAQPAPASQPAESAPRGWLRPARRHRDDRLPGPGSWRHVRRRPTAPGLRDRDRRSDSICGLGGDRAGAGRLSSLLLCESRARMACFGID
jgi:hypothetical protein